MFNPRLWQISKTVSLAVLRSLAPVWLPLGLMTPGLLAAQTTRTPLAVRTAQAVPTAVDAGQVAASTPIELTLTLKPGDDREAALTQFLTDASTAGSASYRQWVTPAQFGARFGATSAQQQAAAAWVLAQGMTTMAISPSGLRMTVTGSAQQVQAAFQTTLHTLALGQNKYFAAVAQPSLDETAAGLFNAVDGLDTLPAPAISAQTGVATDASSLTPALLGQLIDTNAQTILALASAACSTDLSDSQKVAYAEEFRQAAAQGITVLSTRTCTSGAFPAMLAEVTGVAAPGALADTATAPLARPGWQSATGLPDDALRHVPDLTVASLSALTQALTQIAGGTRLGNLNPIFYELAPVAGLYTQPDAAPAGTWEAATGLGLLDLTRLATVFPRGTGSSYTSFAASNYSPVHGQGTTFSSAVTSGTGGATPTGTVSYVTSAGTVLGTATLVNGNASVTLTTLDGGNLTVQARYSGDATYAASLSPMSQLYVQPEPSQLAASVTGQPVVGSNYTLTVTDTAASGVGTPSGGITVSVSGTTTSYTGTLTPGAGSTSSVSFSIPATAPGTITLSINCTASANYSCTNPYTTTVTIQKATPTLSISYTPNPVVSGSTITLNAVVAAVGAAPTPTGNVRFFDNGTLLNASALSNGSTSTTGQVPTTSTHSITATYDGDANYNTVSTNAGSTSSGTIATTLALAASASTVTAGQSISFTATLTAASTGPANPTGSVAFFDGSAQIGTANLVGNAATFATSSLSATANHTITAVYSGDGYYSASTSPGVSVARSNTGNASTTTIAVSPSAPVHGQSVTFTAVVAASNGGATPTGTVTFQNTQTGTLGTATLQNGVATFSTNQLAAGTYTLVASYAGDATYAASASPAGSVTISAEPVTLTVTPAANATFGTSFTVVVQVTGQSGVSYPQGTVTVKPRGTGYSGSYTGSVTSAGTTSSGSAAVVIPSTGAGSVSFTATYSGDTNFASAGPVTATGTVAQATSSTVLTFNPGTPVAGQQTVLTAKVSFASSTAPTGTVQFLDGSSLLGTATLDTTGTATLTTVFTAGNHTVTAVYSGDTNYTASTSPARSTSTGTNSSSTAITVNPSSASLGSAVTLGVTVTSGSSGTVPTGSVQFVGGGAVLCTVTLANGSGTCSYTPVTAGSLAITGNYLGDTTYAASSSAAVTLTVNGPAGALTATISPASGAGGATATVTATVTAPTGTVPSGIVSVAVSNAAGTVVSTANANLSAGTGSSAAVAIPITIPATAGVYSVTVTCSSTNVTCGTVNLTVTSTGSARISTSTVLTATGTASSAVLTASVTPASTGSAAVSGTVTFYDGTTQVGAGVVSAGVASATVTLTGTTHSLTAVYSGDTLYAGSASAVVTSITTPATSVPSISLTVNMSTGLAGSPLVFTASITGATSAGVVPTGTVSFYAFGTTSSLLGTVTIGQAGAGLATGVLSTASVPVGTASVYAVYSGDTNFSTVTSNSVLLSLSDYTVTFVPQSLTLTAGQTGHTTLILGSVNGFTGTVNFGCTPPPNAQITCSFSSTALAGGSGSTILTVNTVASKAQSSQQARLSGMQLAGGASFAALLLGLIPASRRRRLPALLLALLGLALAANTGCSSGTFNPIATGTPLGTVNVTVTTATTDGVNTVKHTYAFPVTIQ